MAGFRGSRLFVIVNIVRSTLKKLILSTTASFSKTVETTDLKNRLAEAGCEVVLHDSFEPPFPFDAERVVAIVAGHTPKGEMLFVGPKEAAHFPHLKVVSPFGVGTNHIGLDGLTAAGYTVLILPSLSKRTVAELAIASMFALARRLTQQTAAIKSGVWQREDGRNLEGKTVGIIGLGNIGKEVVKLVRALGMQVLACDIVYDDSFNSEWQIKTGEVDDVCRRSDFLTLHVPLTTATKDMIGEREFTLMKDGIFFINAARGEIVEHAALLRALESGKVAGAALDVFTKEPPFGDVTLERIIAHRNVVLTPHVGAFTPETRKKIATFIIEHTLSFI